MTDYLPLTERETYWGGWWSSRRKPTVSITEEEARRRHQGGEEYAVVLSDGGRPVVALTVLLRPRAPFTKVEFLDDRLFPKYAYAFTTPQEGAREGVMFLENMYEEEWSDDEKHLGTTDIRFWVDGRSHKYVYDHVNRTTEEGWAEELLTAEELEVHWEPIPEFGDWDSIIRLDRSEAP